MSTVSAPRARCKARTTNGATHARFATILPRVETHARIVFRGVKCELKFKSYARDSMLPHLFRFDACHSTIDAIDRATTVRDALFGERNDCNDDQIMRAIE